MRRSDTRDPSPQGQPSPDGAEPNDPFASPAPFTEPVPAAAGRASQPGGSPPIPPGSAGVALPSPDDDGDITSLIHASARNVPGAEERLFRIVDPDLTAMARRRLAKERLGDPPRPPELVSETYIRLKRQKLSEIKNRSQFFRIVDRFMERVLWDLARVRLAQKRGNGFRKHSVDVLDQLETGESTERSIDALTFQELLLELGRFDAQTARVVVLHFFDGLSTRAIAKALGVKVWLVNARLRTAERWLGGKLRGRD